MKEVKPHLDDKYGNSNFLLTESAVITGKYHAGVLTVRTEPGGQGPYIEDPSLISSRNEPADEVNERFIIWLVSKKKNLLRLVKTYYIRIGDNEWVVKRCKNQ